MKVRVLSVFLLLCGISASAQQTANLSRLTTAGQWLEDLCIIPATEWSGITAKDLSSALAKWNNSKQPSSQCNLSHSDQNDKINLNDTQLVPRIWDRFLRVLDFQTEFQQTPAYVYAIPLNSPSGTTPTFLPNPNHALLGFSGPLHLDELYISTETRVALCDLLTDQKPSADSQNTEVIDKQSVDVKNPHLRENCKHYKYLSANGARDRLGRVANAITLNIGFSEAPKVESGVVIAEEFSGFQHWNPTITGSFDPSKLFRSASDTQKLQAYIQNHTLTDFPSKSSDELYKCNPTHWGESKEVRNCIRTLALGRKDHQIYIGIVPMLTVKVTTPFDLAKLGNTFLDPPNHSGQPLYDVSLRWNLQRAKPSAAANIAALTALIPKKSAGITNANESPSNSSCQQLVSDWKKRVKVLFFELKMEPEVSEDNEWWAILRSAVLESPLSSKACVETNNSQTKPASQ